MHRCAAFRFLLIFPVLLLLFGLAQTPCRAGSEGETDSDAATSQTAAADQFFGQSTLVGSTTSLREGETITNTLTVRYNGEENPMPISIVFPIPQPAMFVSASPKLSPPEDKREVQWQGAVERGKDLVFTITLITMPNSASNRTLRSSAAIYWRGHNDGPNWQGGVQWVQTEAEIHTRLQPQTVTLPGGKAVSQAEATILVYLVGGPLLIILIPWLIRQREKSRMSDATGSSGPDSIDGVFLHAQSFAFVVLVGVAHMLVWTVTEDYRRLNVFPQAECIILDKTITIGKIQARSGQTQSRSSRYNEPVVAVRYRLDDAEMTVAGPPKITSISSPLQRFALRQLARFEIGRSYPCWVDPRDPHVFFLIRGISWGWYLLVVPPTIILWFLARYLWRRFTGSTLSPGK
jgi:hypothetical protein